MALVLVFLSFLWRADFFYVFIDVGGVWSGWRIAYLHMSILSMWFGWFGLAV